MAAWINLPSPGTERHPDRRGRPRGVENGVNGILVSTHGGRQMDSTMGAIEMVPEVVEAAKGQAEVYVDSGVRRGSDVIKALALGAKAVAIGRPLFWGLAVNGADGVHGVLELLREEVDRAMSYCGQTNIRELEPNLVNIPSVESGAHWRWDFSEIWPQGTSLLVN